MPLYYTQLSTSSLMMEAQPVCETLYCNSIQSRSPEKTSMFFAAHRWDHGICTMGCFPHLLSVEACSFSQYFVAISTLLSGPNRWPLRSLTYLLRWSYVSQPRIDDDVETAMNYVWRKFPLFILLNLHSISSVFRGVAMFVITFSFLAHDNALRPPTGLFVFSQWFLSMEPWWNDTGRGRPKNSERNVSQCHFVHHKSQMNWLGREPGPPRW
jgi:hypothetical protein